MLHPKEILESRVVRDYLKGKTREQIANDNSTSTDNVSNITKEWKQRIGEHEAEEIREFVVLVKKSGLSVKQCADGFRTAQLMKKLCILSEDENDQDNNEEFTAFVKKIYLNCKNVGIDPPILFRWIRDLYDCFSIENNNNNDNSSFSIATNLDNEEVDKYNEEAQPEIPQHQRLQSGCEHPLDCLQQNETNGAKNLNGLSHKDLLSQEGSGDTLYPNPHSANGIKIPFISQISDFIAQRKKECIELKKHKTHLEIETKRAELQEKRIKENLVKTIKKERLVMHCFEWFYKLKQELWDRYSIRIEEIPRFTKVINEFKNHNYDPYEITNEYSRFESVGQEITIKKSELEILQQKERWLKGNIVSLEARLSISKQTTDAFYQIGAMGFGLLELKQIYDVILEISSHRNITPKEATDIFIKDIEKNYFDKLLFEDRVNERKAEFDKIRQEIPNYRYNLQLESYIKHTLTHLLLNGVTHEDIINFSQLFTYFANNTFFLDPQGEGEIESGKNLIEKDITKPKVGIKDWRTFTDKLKKLGDINSAIREQEENLAKTEKQVASMNQQKHELDAHNKTATSLMIYKNAQISYMNGYLNYIYKNSNKKINGPFQPNILFVNIICINKGKDDKGKGQNK